MAFNNKATESQSYEFLDTLSRNTYLLRGQNLILQSMISVNHNIVLTFGQY